MPLNELQINVAPELMVAALWYTSHGFPMFPCKPRRKEPLCQHGFKDATTDEKSVKAWWTKWPQANLGMPTGSASGLLFLDCDPRNGGPASRSELVERFGPVPETAEAVTGGGGRHFVFRDPGVPVPKELAPGIDLKGEGGYVVLPPSIHPSGKQYEWAGPVEPEAIKNAPSIPAWLSERLLNRQDTKKRDVERAAVSDKWFPGERNNRMASLAGTMRRPLTWRLLFVSAGELTLAEHAASVGKKTKGGVEVRLLNVRADAIPPVLALEVKTCRETTSFGRGEAPDPPHDSRKPDLG